MARLPDPFVLDVRAFRHLPGRFTYVIHRRGELKHRSLHTYTTFEEARRAGKAALDAPVAEWKRHEGVEQPA